MDQDKLYQYILMLGDNAMILGHRLSELCGHGPTLETDIALTNISLDLFGQVRNYFQYAAEVKSQTTENPTTAVTEDSLAFLRKERQYLNVVLVEQPNVDFAHVVIRQFLYDAYQSFLMPDLMKSKDERISAIAHKAIKESKYHLRFSSEWVKRLGAGTEESHAKMASALSQLYPFTGELFKASEIESEMQEAGIGGHTQSYQEPYTKLVQSVLSEAGLALPDTLPRVVNGKTGVHSEHMGYILADLQYMQRAYPNMQW